jgi:hypothetical protein
MVNKMRISLIALFLAGLSSLFIACSDDSNVVPANGSGDVDVDADVAVEPDVELDVVDEETGESDSDEDTDGSGEDVENGSAG